MKKALALAALISASAIGGAYAQDYGTTTPTPSTANVTVVYITDTNSDDSAVPAIPPTLRLPNAEAAQAAQVQIQSDPTLLAALEEKNVELGNVAGIQTAADGSKIVYVR